jgi:hypothetical protein
MPLTSAYRPWPAVSAVQSVLVMLILRNSVLL